MDLTFNLLLLGLIVAAQAQNCARPVGNPNTQLKGDDILLHEFQDGATVSFTCVVGYSSAGGSSTIKCVGGTWTPLRLTCQKKNCGPFHEVLNGHIDYSEGTDFGDKIQISCNRGYNLVGKSEVLCGDAGWMSRPPVCEVTACAPPAEVKNGNFNPSKENYNYGEVVQYNCVEPHSLNGSKSSSCSEDGTFKPNPPTCVMVSCEEPVVANGEWVSGSRPPYHHLATVTFRCLANHDMVGQQTQICDINSLWTPGLPTCKLRTTPKATTTTATATTATTTTTTTTTTAAATTKPSDKQTDATVKPDSGSDKFKQYGIPILISISVLVSQLHRIYQ